MASIRARASVADGLISVKALIRHPMETGQRKDAAGNRIPAHFIQEVMVEKNGAMVMSAVWGGGVSTNPSLSCAFAGASGDKVKISWKDNQGQSDSTEVAVK